MFEKLVLLDDQFKKYLKLKGEYLYKQIYDVLLEKNSEQVLYSELSSIIRYDKTLRDKLYIYLATFEEALKAEIFRKYDVDDLSINYNDQKVDILVNNVNEKTNSDSSNLYFCFELCLGGIINFIQKKQMFDQNYIKHLINIKNLRNKVMHHNLVIFGKEKTFEGVLKNIEEVNKLIKSLVVCLPDEYKNGFLNDINNLKCDVSEFKIILRDEYE